LAYTPLFLFAFHSSVPFCFAWPSPFASGCVSPYVFTGLSPFSNVAYRRSADMRHSRLDSKWTSFLSPLILPQIRPAA
jgi:hypothetical protein